MGNLVQNVYTDEAALALYKRAEKFAPTSLQIKYRNEHNIVFDGPVPGAFSSKAFLDRIFINNQLKVFKFPLTDDLQQQQAINRDTLFCERYTTHEKFTTLEGVVPYEPFRYDLSDGTIVSGSVSPAYIMSLADFTSAFSFQSALIMCQRILDTIKRVHSCGLVINDIKPANIYMAQNGLVDIADFGGFCEIGQSLSDVEITVGYIPEDLISQIIAIPSIDFMCLVASILEIVKAASPEPRSTATLRSIVVGLTEGDLKSLLLSLF